MPKADLQQYPFVKIILKGIAHTTKSIFICLNSIKQQFTVIVVKVVIV